ncbi:hypothetical protein E2562_006761 [Oryza meyeriana var. granulata]|uniref:Uncharacterized protein n=1 Tax=Oryza meyeriana var. granulata TaxID=110450 RepID=A0A6G1C667_9ORYZ|nr:hypothetical protein E2562_006761 [Oryza meyeriana var. granulata]
MTSIPLVSSMVVGIFHWRAPSSLDPLPPPDVFGKPGRIPGGHVGLLTALHEGDKRLLGRGGAGVPAVATVGAARVLLRRKATIAAVEAATLWGHLEALSPGSGPSGSASSGPGRVSPVPGGAASGRVWQPGDQTSRPQHPTGAPPGVAQPGDQTSRPQHPTGAPPGVAQQAAAGM